MSGAATLLGVTQPVVSRSVRALEEQAGEALVEPHGRGIRLTQRGVRLAERAARVLDAYDTILTAQSDGASELRLASYEPFSTWAIPRIIASAQVMQTLCLEAVPGEIERLISDGRVDLGFTTSPVRTAGVEHRQIATIRSAIVGNRSAAEQFRGQKVSDLPFVAPVASGEARATGRVTLDDWPASARRTVVHRVTMMETAMELVREGEAVAWLPRWLLARHNELVAPARQLQVLTQSRRVQTAPVAVFAATPTGHAHGESARAVSRMVGILSERSRPAR